MGRNLTYYGLAMDDFRYMEAVTKEGLVHNHICNAAKSCIEKLLKHVIEPYATEMEDTAIMRTHDLAALKSFATCHLHGFRCDWGKVMLANGFFFSPSQPGDEVFFVWKQDVDDCREAAYEARKAVEAYMRTEEWGHMSESMHPSREEVEKTVEEVLKLEEDYGHIDKRQEGEKEGV